MLRTSLPLILLSGAAFLSTAPDPLFAQRTTPPPTLPLVEERPRELTKVTINGTKALDKAELMQNLALVPSRCASLLLTPFCWVSHASVFYQTSYLDHDELARDVLRARVFYYQRGFREATVDTTVTPRPKHTVHVTLDIDEGPPTTVSSIRIDQDNRILQRRDIGRALFIRRTEPLNVFSVDSTRLRLQETLQDKGFLDAVVDTIIAYDSAQRTAAITFTTEPHQRSRVSSIAVEGLENIEEETIRKSLLFKEGDILRRSVVLNTQRLLYQSNLFRRAAIDVAGNDSLKDVIVTVTEAPPREVRLAGGFNTIDFLQIEGRYTNYNFRGGARRLTAQATIGNLLARQLNGTGIFYDVANNVVGADKNKYFVPTFTASIESRRPWFLAPQNEIAVGVFGHRRSSPGIYIDKGYGASGTFTRMMAPRTPLSANYRFEVTSVDAGDIYFCVNYGVCDNATLSALHKSQTMSPFAITASADRTDDPYSPRRGTRGQLDAEVATKWTGSDFRYGRVSFEWAGFLPVRRSSTFGGRIRVGYVNAYRTSIGDSTVDGTGNILHPRKRFYAGGSQSVRGFSESQLGPRVLTIPESKLRSDSVCPAALVPDIRDCDPNMVLTDRDFDPRPLGGNVLFEASMEFRFPIMKDLVGAVFIDGAYLAQRTDRGLPKSKAAATPGFGVRYNSPAGPIRVDIGINPVTTERLAVITEQTAPDGSRQLVRLNNSRTYAPAKGGFKEFLSRITLHLSIGEAF